MKNEVKIICVNETVAQQFKNWYYKVGEQYFDTWLDCQDIAENNFAYTKSFNTDEDGTIEITLGTTEYSSEDY